MDFKQLYSTIRSILCNYLNCCDAWIAKYNELNKKYYELQNKYIDDTNYYEARIKKLTELLSESIVIPNINAIINEEPFKLTYNTIHNILSNLGVKDIDIADLNYITFSKDTIEKVLTEINNLIKAKWTSDVFDCDDFALLMNALVAYTFYKNNFKAQLAFGIAWSTVHAFNIYIDNNYEVWIWEPQLAKTVGKAYDYLNTLNYCINEAWFMG